MEQIAYHADDEEEGGRGGLIVKKNHVDTLVRLKSSRANKRSLEKKFRLGNFLNRSISQDTVGTMPTTALSTAESSVATNSNQQQEGTAATASSSSSSSSSQSTKQRQEQQEQQESTIKQQQEDEPGTYFFNSHLMNNNNNNINDFHSSLPANLTYNSDDSCATGSSSNQFYEYQTNRRKQKQRKWQRLSMNEYTIRKKPFTMDELTLLPPQANRRFSSSSTSLLRTNSIAGMQVVPPNPLLSRGSSRMNNTLQKASIKKQPKQEKTKNQLKRNQSSSLQPGAHHIAGPPSLFPHSTSSSVVSSSSSTSTPLLSKGAHRVMGAPSNDKQHSNRLQRQQEQQQPQTFSHRFLIGKSKVGGSTPTPKILQQQDIENSTNNGGKVIGANHSVTASKRLSSRASFINNNNNNPRSITSSTTMTASRRMQKENAKNQRPTKRFSPVQHVRCVDERIERKRTRFGIGRLFSGTSTTALDQNHNDDDNDDGPSNVTIDDGMSVFTSHSTTTRQVENGRNFMLQEEENHQSALFGADGLGGIQLPTDNHDQEEEEEEEEEGEDDVLMPLGTRSLQGANQPQRFRVGRHCLSHASVRSMGTFIDEQGRSMTVEEMREIWTQHGLCHRCGQIQTHRKVKHGPFGLWRKSEPLTEEGKSYEGYCLPCHTVPELRVLLNDPNIPLDLPRDEQQVDNRRSSIPLRKSLSPLALLLFDIKFQICLGLFGLAAFGGLLATALLLAKSDTGTNTVVPTVAPTANTFPTTSIPTMTPTTQDWKLVTSIIPEDALLEESFGHSLTFEASGDFLAVSAPLAHNKRGQVTVYEIYTIEENNTVSYRPLGQPILGNNEGDLAGLEMTYSLDGFWLAIGYAGEGNGMVRIFELSDSDDEWIQRGQALESPSPMSEFGKTLAFNANGDVVAIGAPGYQNDTGLVQTFVFDGSEWQKLGSDLVGESIGDRFGASASINQDGEFMVVGAPMANSARWKNAGIIYWYEKPNNEVGYQRLGSSRQSELLLKDNRISGDRNGHQLGTHLELSSDGTILFSSSPAINNRGKRGVGTVELWAIDPTFNERHRLAIPVFGQDSMTGLGSDLTAPFHFNYMAVSTRNQPRSIGEARAYLANQGNVLIPWGNVIDPPPLGNGRWLGLRPSVAIGSDQKRLAVGYQSVLLPNGESKPVINIYNFS